MEAKLRLLVEAPAAVEDALASLLNHIDPQVQVDTQDVCMLSVPFAQPVMPGGNRGRILSTQSMSWSNPCNEHACR